MEKKNTEPTLVRKRPKQSQAPRLTSNLLSQLEKSSSMVEFECKDSPMIQIPVNNECLVRIEVLNLPVAGK